MNDTDLEQIFLQSFGWLSLPAGDLSTSTKPIELGLLNLNFSPKLGDFRDASSIL
jgi:hypothetical protein